ncbi:MAG: hypothetical protein NC180_06465 [Muribaculaceae bacterium]|nr:hypothetical protein [Roseburia sp.]MCM1492851.1 hypothetical protein [Muribaculaceae bacterium]
MYNLSEIVEMFNTADGLIAENPTLLSMSTDQIFDDLDDGTDKMRHIRWGVMTRAKMRELKSFDIQDIIIFLLTIEDHNLLAEYIGFILQREHDISLLELLLEAYQQGVQKQILPFVKECIEYEKDCFIEQIDNILELIKNIGEESDRNLFLNGYAYLVVSKKEETLFLEKYISDYSESLRDLVVRIGAELYNKRRENAEKWLDIFLNEKSEHCRVMGIEFLYKSIFLECIFFEKYFEFLENDLCKNEILWEALIPVYAHYLVSESNVLYREDVKKRLCSIKDNDLSKKRKLIQSIGYYIRKYEDYIELIDQITSVSFEKDNQILRQLDYYLEYKFEINADIAIKKLYDIYNVNAFKFNEPFLSLLPQTCSLMKQQMKKLIFFWCNKFLYGTIREFSLSLDIFSCVIKLEDMVYLFGVEEKNKEELMNILEGILLFTFNEKRMVDLVFEVSASIKDKDFFFEYCRDNVYANYSGALLEKAQNYVESKNEYQSDLAHRLIEYHKSYIKKIQLGYEDKDFMPSTERQRVYQEVRLEQNRKINERAEEGSVFAHIFPVRKMKYGKRFAFVQIIKKGEYCYKVSEYAHHTMQVELPRSFINDPVRHTYLKSEYLRKRGNNEAYS